jgi:hypothetical protein
MEGIEFLFYFLNSFLKRRKEREDVGFGILFWIEG